MGVPLLCTAAPCLGWCGGELLLCFEFDFVCGQVLYDSMLLFIICVSVFRRYCRLGVFGDGDRAADKGRVVCGLSSPPLFTGKGGVVDVIPIGRRCRQCGIEQQQNLDHEDARGGK